MSSNSDIPKAFHIIINQQKFINKSLHGIKKSRLKQLLLTAILAEKPRLANIFAAEMVVSNFYQDLWDSIFYIFLTKIACTHINLISLLIKHLHTYTELRNNHHIKQLKNKQQIRNMFAQIVTILCLQDKEKSFVAKVTTTASQPDANALADFYLGQATKKKETRAALRPKIVQFITDLKTSKSSIELIKSLYFSHHKLDPIKHIRMSATLATNPCWILWVILDNCVKNGKKSILTGLRHLFIVLSNHEQELLAIECLTTATNFVKTNQEIKVVDEILLRTVLRETIRINYTYLEVGSKIKELDLARVSQQK